ncbi:MAG: hypothetical protein KG012_01055 [Deltaproteobacteria bacterium]|nr:hypothetical protein [Deltaproteobacteria bacterium]
MRRLILKTIQYISLSLRRERAGVRVDNLLSPSPLSPPLPSPKRFVQAGARGGDSFAWFKAILNSRGLSVLFLVIAMMLMVSIGYVFSYLIPTKQKSVSLTVSSNQAFFIAQSGVEFAVRYATDQGWANKPALNGLDNMTRNLGRGSFVLDYDDLNDRLISRGQIPNSSERRIVVSSFTSFLMTYFGSASTPADNGTNNANPTAVTPPGGMQAGDLVLMIGQARANAGALTISNAGGQSWTLETQQNQTNCRIRLFWCRFNGTWSANPSVSLGSTNCNTVVMHVFRPPNTSSVWQVDVAQVSGNFTAPPAPNRTVTIPGITTITDGALVFATWASRDDNTWGSLTGTGAWFTPGSAQYRNTSGADQSQTHAYKVMATAGASGNVSKNQLTLGGDAGAYLIIAFKAVII